MPNLNEAETIARAMGGDQLAFRSLVEQFQGFVYSIPYRFAKDGAEAEDLAQECFIRVWKNLDRYNPEYKFRTWIGKIITNICLDLLRSARKKNKMNSIAMEENFEVADVVNHEKELHASELQKIILQLAEALTPKQKAAFILRDLEMLDVTEACEMLNESAENLKSNLYYARKHVRENLLKYYKTSLT